MGDSDLKLIMGIAITAVLWGLFNFLWISHSLAGYSSSSLPGYSEQSGFVATLSMATSFLTNLASIFSPSYLYINIIVWPILLFGLLVVALRFIRGQ